MGRPIVTTDAVGCREVVEDSVNGFLCNVQDGQALAVKMAHIAAMSHDQLTTMGQNGRNKVEREFDEKIVIERYIEQLTLLADH